MKIELNQYRNKDVVVTCEYCCSNCEINSICEYTCVGKNIDCKKCDYILEAVPRQLAAMN